MKKDEKKKREKTQKNAQHKPDWQKIGKRV